MAEIIERIPGVPYGFLEIRASDAKELLAVRGELQETHPEYFDESGDSEEKAVALLENVLGATEVKPVVDLAAKKAALLKGKV